MLDDPPPFVLATPPDPMIGQLIDHYILEKKLGQGGMGAVHLGVHEEFATTRCVIKTMLPEMARHPIAVARFWNEMQAVSVLNHENVVKILNFGKLPDGRLFMRFEFVEGMSLDKHLAARGGRLPLRVVLYLVFQVCDALDHVHAAGVVHRDLKPENLLLLIDLVKRVPLLMKIVDFGISKVPSSGKVQTHTGMAMGTPTHMAVEQHDSPGDVKASADVYALAIVIWELLTGSLPWGNPEVSTVLYHLQRTQIPAAPPEDLMPAAIRAILLRCLSPEPTDRPPCSELAIALAAAVGAESGEPSGTDLLEDLVPRWVVSAPASAVTTPNTVGRDRINIRLWVMRQAEVLLGIPPERGAGHLPPLNVITESSRPSPAAQPPVQAPTSHDRPRALAGAAAARSPAPPSSAPAPAAPAPPAAAPVQAATRQEHLATHPAAESSAPLLAALPTGLISQKFAAVQPPVARVVPVVASAEFVMATGTPGPDPRAHADIPRVIVSTQLSELSSQARALGSRPFRPDPEPPPFVVLPGGARPSTRAARGTRVVLVAAACALVAVAGFAVMRRGSGVSASGADVGSGSAHGSASAVSVAAATANGGVAAPAPRLAGSASAPHPAETNHVDAAANSGSASFSASTQSKADIAPTVRPDNAAATMPPVDRRAATVAPETSRTVSRPAPTQKPLRTRRLEAHASGAKTGSLHLLVTPWAVCWVDGERIDQTPCMLDGLPVGRYRVRLENSVAHKEETLTATVTSGETTTIERTW
jgi:serine/threonine-protein kinase